jgi:hypothetical protein
MYLATLMSKYGSDELRFSDFYDQPDADVFGDDIWLNRHTQISSTRRASDTSNKFGTVLLSKCAQFLSLAELKAPPAMLRSCLQKLMWAMRAHELSGEEQETIEYSIPFDFSGLPESYKPDELNDLASSFDCQIEFVYGKSELFDQYSGAVALFNHNDGHNIISIHMSSIHISMKSDIDKLSELKAALEHELVHLTDYWLTKRVSSIRATRNSNILDEIYQGGKNPASEAESFARIKKEFKLKEKSLSSWMDKFTRDDGDSSIFNSTPSIIKEHGEESDTEKSTELGAEKLPTIIDQTATFRKNEYFPMLISLRDNFNDFASNVPTSRRRECLEHFLNHIPMVQFYKSKSNLAYQRLIKDMYKITMSDQQIAAAKKREEDKLMREQLRLRWIELLNRFSESSDPAISENPFPYAFEEIKKIFPFSGTLTEFRSFVNKK